MFLVGLIILLHYLSTHLLLIANFYFQKLHVTSVLENTPAVKKIKKNFSDALFPMFKEKKKFGHTILRQHEF